MLTKLFAPKSENTYLIILLVLALILWLLFLGNLPLRDWDEGIYALVSREIYREHHWIYPTINNQPFLLKPPLTFWLISLTYHLGGVNEFTTRFFPAFLTCLGVPLLYLLGKELFKENLPSLYSSLVYLTLLPIVRHGRLAMLDGMSITFFILLLFCLLKCKDDKRWSLGVGFCFSLIILTKGLLVILFAAIAFLFLLFNQQFLLLINPIFWIGLILGIMPSFAWYYAQFQHYGNQFLEVHFLSQGFSRVSQSVEGNKGDYWYYLLEIIKYGFPWLLFVPQGLYLSWQKRDETWSKLVIIGILGYLIPVSIMGTKLPWYILPIYLFLALLVGKFLAEVAQHHINISLGWIAILGIFALGGIAGCYYFATVDKQIILIVMSIVLLITMISVCQLIIMRNKQFINVLFCGLYLVLLLFVSSQSWIWELNEKFPVKPVANLIREYLPPGTKIYTSFPYNRPSLDFYCDCQVIPAKNEDLPNFLLSQNPILIDSKNPLDTGLILGKAGDFILMK